MAAMPVPTEAFIEELPELEEISGFGAATIAVGAARVGPYKGASVAPNTGEALVVTADGLQVLAEEFHAGTISVEHKGLLQQQVDRLHTSLHRLSGAEAGAEAAAASGQHGLPHLTTRELHDSQMG